ncbi:MAG: hypothetical protein AAGA70_17405 [Pseudomonadota bacterium]
MNISLGLAMVLAILGVLLAAMLGVRKLAKARGWHAELQRKIVHVGAGGMACALPWLLPAPWQVWALLALTALAMLALRLPAFSGVGGTLHDVGRRSWGDFLLVLAVALIYLLHQGIAVLYVLPLAILTLADAAAALAGIRYGRMFFATEDGTKSVEGSVMFFLVALILGMVCLLLMTEIPRASVITVALAVAGFATLLEADSWHGFDNLFLPMGAYILLATLLIVPPWQAAAQIVIAIAGAGAVYALRERMGASLQVARVHALAMFLLLCVVFPMNAVLPALALILPAVFYAPLRDGPLALGWVAALALLSFVYFAYEPASGRTAINLFGLAFAGMVAAWAGFAARPAIASLTALGLAAIWLVVAAVNPETAQWHGDIRLLGIVSILASAAIAATASRVLAPRPILSITALGSAGPSLFLVATLSIGAP